MSNPRKLGELAELIGGRVEGDPERLVSGVAVLEDAGEKDLSFVRGNYKRAAEGSRAGAFLVGEGLEGLDRDLLVSARPRHALASLIDLFHPEEPPAVGAGVHETAVIQPDAEVHPTASIGPYCVVGSDSTIGEGAVLHAHVVIGRRCTVGPAAVLHPDVVLYDDTHVGARSLLHAGVKIGADGYGFASDARGHQ